MAGKPPSLVRKVHPHAWLWEPFEDDATFVLRSMFGAKAVYLDGRMTLCFCAGEEPWRGLLVCTEREHHAALVAEFPVLTPHTILPKWLYLPESADSFERDAEKLVRLARTRDKRIGILPKARRRRTKGRQSSTGENERTLRPQRSARASNRGSRSKR